MKLNKLTALVLLLMGGSFLLGADVLEVRRFGLFVGANDGGDARQRLLYADDDARAMGTTMEEIGGIHPADSILLLDPETDDIMDALEELSLRINGVENLVRRTEIMFYYSGHSDETGLMLSDEKLPYKEIRASLDESGADVVIAVLDSCSSGAFTRAKGGSRRSPFLVDESSSMEGHAFLTSSSETELSQESDRIEGSFFTYYLITGLRGAADNTRDGRVSLNEVYEHTFRETLSGTESTLGGAQHPAYEIQLTGTGDLVLTDLNIPTSALQVSGELAGRFSVRTGDDKLVAEFTKHEEDTFKLALPAGEYKILRARQGKVETAEIVLNRNGQFFLTEKDFSRNFLEMTRFRGDSPDEDTPSDRGNLTEVPFTLSLLPGLNFPSIDDDSLVRCQLGFSSYAEHLEGIQLNYLFNIAGEDSMGIQASNIFNITASGFSGIQGSGIFNIAGGNLEGVQGSGVFNIAEGSVQGIQGAGIFNIAGGYLQGVQGAGIFNIADDHCHGVQASGLFNIAGEDLQGIQASGLFNIAGEPSSGLQTAGLFNIAGELRGFQAAGLFNKTNYLEGTQVAVVNRAKTMNGLQLGLINSARELDGVAIGLLNFSRNGIVDSGVWYEYEGDKRLYSYFQSGNNKFYTLFFAGNNPDLYFEDWSDMVWGAHMGSRLEIGPFLADVDVGVRTSLKDFWSNPETHWGVPSGRAVVSLKGLGLFWGISAVLQYPDGPSSSLYSGPYTQLGEEEGLGAYYNYIVGLRI